MRGLWIGMAALLTAATAPAAPVAIRGAMVHPISAPVIVDGVLVMEGGEIMAVGRADAVEVPADATLVDGTGLHLWPGLVDAMSHLGLIEIGSVRGTRDHTESGQMNPNARAEVAINASSPHIAVTRANGTLLAATVPFGSLVPGTAAGDLDAVVHAAEGAPGLKALPASGDDRADRQAVVGGLDAQDPLGDGDVVPGGGAR